MDKATIERYSRQILVSGVGLGGQRSLAAARVLIVGCGGLGCPVALYLAAAGVGHLRVCDADTVDVSNLPRQVLHHESSIGTSKTLSIKHAIAAVNSHVNVDPRDGLVTRDNVLALMQDCAVVVDATDNVVTRYLLNDAAVIAGIPLVSGAALGWTGQVSVFNYRTATYSSPCYRCLYPEPPPAAAVTNCDLAGVIGPVTGIVGSLQALQVLRILMGLPPACTDSLLAFSGDDCDRLFRQLRLRPRNTNCIACGDDGTHRIYDRLEARMTLDYIHFCGGQQPDDKTPSLHLLPEDERISSDELHRLLQNRQTEGRDVLLVDVRPASQFELCSLPGSHSIPFESLSHPAIQDHILQLATPHAEIVFVCRRGNDSQVAVAQFRELLTGRRVRDLVGGLRQWALTVDPDMPIY